ncbi:hypothetical protein HIM_04543 [Hirsutella minnesotensis 3608]|uniref:Uncharacterized protein n=1 Tax=Hirsutella minnesotensis 3608 TaxID=1043627 RepID=A0A0F8A1B9_9HYPO|nr:hypothetical protein HIM_04543 [Hirsutella minnesotensis 3608]
MKRSKGKRATRKQTKTESTGCPVPNFPVPPKPELCASIDVGFNVIARRLGELSSASQEPTPEQSTKKPYSMVFVARGNQSPAFNCHFPKMVAAASRGTPQANGIRLIGFSKPCSERLSSCLGIAHVSSMALTHDAPGAGALWEFVQKTVPSVDMSWLREVNEVRYRDVSIDSAETVMGSKRVKAA